MKNQKSDSKMSRRSFLSTSLTAAAGLTIVPSFAVSGLGHKAPSDKLNIAGVGVGGMGRSNLNNMKSENIVALCDVDYKYAKDTFNDFPDAKRYRDYRKMLDEMESQIDAVMIATPDHTHALIASDAMKRGMHVYVQKPLTHSVYEARYLAQVANETGVVTQMGNQGNSSNDIKEFSELFWDNAIGPVKEVHTWTNRPIWPQGLERPEKEQEVPDTLSWNLFLGPAPKRPYNKAYHPWNWRGWWDFGTGALGDMGCHIVDPAFKALKLGYPYAFEASSTTVNTESPPNAEKVTYWFPKRKSLKKVSLPEVKLTWYDGGLMPERPKELEAGEMMGDSGGGTLLVGERGKLICGTYGQNPKLLPKALNENYTRPEKSLRRVKNAMDGGHEQDWIRAIKESPDNRTMPSSNFNYAGPLTETVVMGNLGVRLQQLNRTLKWDSKNMKITNIGENEKISVVTSQGFEVVNGDPKFNTQHTKINASEAAKRYVKHEYRNGWELK